MVKKSKKNIKYLKSLTREATKDANLSTRVMEDKRTKRNRTKREQNKKAIEDSNEED